MVTTTTDKEIWLSGPETAKMIRRAVKESFPGVKFSVRCSRGSAITVKWIDGPTRAAVDTVVGAYEGKTFDGMLDLAGFRTFVFDGQLYGNAFFVFVERGVSPEAMQAALEAERAYWDESTMIWRQLQEAWVSTYEHDRMGPTGNLSGSWRASRAVHDRLEGRC